MHGRGKLKLGDGGLYEGEFRNNEMTGSGLRQWPKGSSYSGEFLDGELHGQVAPPPPLSRHTPNLHALARCSSRLVRGALLTLLHALAICHAPSPGVPLTAAHARACTIPRLSADC